MKKILFGAMVLSASLSFAQNVKPGASYSSNATSLVLSLRDGKVLDAKVYGDMALKQLETKKASGESVKAKVESKIYTKLGMVYFRLANDTEGQESADHLAKAKELFLKEVSFEQAGTNYDEAKGKLTMISKKAYNKATEKYQGQDYEGALAGALEAANISEKLGDKFLQAYYVAALSSIALENHSETIKYCDILLATDFADEKNGPFLYSNKSNAERELGKVEEALKTINKGIKAFPGNIDLYRAETNHYLQTGDSEKAFESLNVLVEQQPNDPLFHALIGDLHGTLANNEKNEEKKKERMLKGIESYKKATEVDPQYYYAYYNAGASLIAISNNILNARNALTLEEAKKKGKEMKAEEDMYYEEAIKMFTACTAIQPNSIEAYEALRKIYFQLDNLEKSSEMKKNIAEIKAQQ